MVLKRGRGPIPEFLAYVIYGSECMQLPLQTEIAALGFVEGGSKSEEALQLSITSRRAQASTATPFADQEQKGKDAV